MYEPLIKIEELNTKCRIILAKTLANYHKVRFASGTETRQNDSFRGLSFFLAFDPWHTCFRFPPGSARFFDAAEANGLLSRDDAAALARTLLNFGVEISNNYNGFFRSYFFDSRIRAILNNINNLSYLSGSGLSVGSSWVDRLFETCPFPIYPNTHLRLQSFQQISIPREIEFYSRSPWLAWVEALDLICVGPWIGLTTAEIIRTVEQLRIMTNNNANFVTEIDNRVLGNKVIIPLFSRGFQGVVVGFFLDVPVSQRDVITASLLEFGESLSDVYADLRSLHFADLVQGELDNESLAKIVIDIVSPVSKIVVSREGQSTGYKITYEDNYWSGYVPLTTDELTPELAVEHFFIAGPGGTEIYIEPLSDILQLNPEFTRVRLETYLNRTLSSISTVQDSNRLSFAEIRQLRKDFEAYAEDGNASLAKLRQYYVVQKIEKYWHNGTVKITNSEMKSYLEGRGRDAKHGYQVTSFASEFEKIFAGKVTATKTRNALSLVWSKTASADANKSRNT